MTKHGSSCTPKTSRFPSRKSCCPSRIQLLEPVCQSVVASSQIAPAEALLALHPATTAGVHQRGATAVAERLAGVVVLAVAHQDGVVGVAALPAGVEMADAQPTAVVMEVVQLMAAQLHMAALLHMEVQHRMVEAQHTAGMTVIAPRTEGSTLVAVHLAGAALALATPRPSQIYQPLLLALTTLLHPAHMRHRHQEGTVPTPPLLLADLWTHLRPEITLRLRREIHATALPQRLHRLLVHGTSRPQRRVAMIPATIERREIV